MKRIMSLLIMCMAVFCFVGCGNASTHEEDENDAVVDRDSYTVYYVNSQETGLVQLEYEYDESSDALEIAEYLFSKLEEGDGLEYRSVIGTGIVATSFMLTDKVLYINFNAEYNNMSDTREVLFKAAVVKTMCQIEGVSYVAFNVDGIPLTYNNGANVGIMEASDFVDESENIGMANSATLDTVVYYSNQTGTALIGESTTIVFGSGVSLETAVVNRIMQGTELSEAKKTVSSSLKLLSTSTRDGVCYVNFDAVFLETMTDVSAEVAVYSIVNSLCELPNIYKVQIMINGSTDYTYRDTYPLNTLFERNLDIIETTY